MAYRLCMVFVKIWFCMKITLYSFVQHFYILFITDKIFKSDWLSTVLISALMGQYVSCLSNWTICTIIRTLGFSLLGKYSQNNNRTLSHPIRSVIILEFKQIGLPLRNCQILCSFSKCKESAHRNKFRETTIISELWIKMFPFFH